MMKKTYSIFVISVVSFFSFLLFTNNSVKAESNVNYSVTYNVESLDGKKVYTYQNGKEVWFFTDKEQYDDFILKQKGFRLVSWTNKVVGTSYKYHVFTAYHDLFPDWSKVSSYTVSNTYTVQKSSSFIYNGFNIGYTVSYSQTGSKTIPADSSRYSRLAYYADLKIIEYKSVPAIKLSYYKPSQSQYRAEVVKTYLEPIY